MRVYLAAPYAVRDVLDTGHGASLEDQGHEVTSTWLQGSRPLVPSTLGPSPDTSDEDVKRHVIQDLEDVFRSDVLVLFTWGYCESVFEGDLGPNSGGRHVETGVALSVGIPVIVLGAPENVFHRGVCTVVEDWAGVLDELQSLHDQRFGINA